MKKEEEMNEKINILIKDKKENDDFKNEIIKKINLLINENNKLKDNLNEIKNQKYEKIEEIKYEKKNEEILEKSPNKEMKEEKKSININNNTKDISEFTNDPQNLKLKKYLSYNSYTKYANAFEVFIGLKDHIEYIAFYESSCIKIMVIKNKLIKYSLNKHKGGVEIIKYYTKENKEEYLLSCDNKKLVIIWDIQNDYNIKYSIQMELSSYIRDMLLLFNINNKDYITISNEGKSEYTKLYELKENTPFIRNIYGTKENETYYSILWKNKNNFYLIECCYEKISINNLLEDECYDNLDMPPEGYHYCGYLYNKNYLCVTSNGSVRIWDLINKEINKEIKIDNPYSIIPWNNNLSIIGSRDKFIIVNIEEKKVLKKIDLDYNLFCLKKIKISEYGECFICANSNGTIILFSS